MSSTRRADLPDITLPNWNVVCDSDIRGPTAVPVSLTLATFPPGVYTLNDSELKVPGIDGVNSSLNYSCDFCFRYPPLPVHLNTWSWSSAPRATS